ncbi:preprotein translocase subunit SecD, partial [Lysobacter sp. 2RAB21]
MAIAVAQLPAAVLPPTPPVEPGVRVEPVAEPAPVGDSAADAAQAFYRMHLELKASGLPVGEDLARYRPMLSKRLLVSGDQLINAVPGTDSRTGQPQVSITLNAIGGQRMLNHTLENVGKPLGIVYVEQVPITQIVDGKEVRTTRTEERVISNSTIQGVFGKEFQTTGLTREESTSLAKQLKSGALAAPMTFVEERVVGPSLGADNVKRGTTAVMFSFIFALTFFLIYYRMFGLITCLALLLNLLM